MSHGYLVSVVALDGVDDLLGLDAVAHIEQLRDLGQQKADMRDLGTNWCLRGGRCIVATAMTVLETANIGSALVRPTHDTEEAIG